MTRVTPEIIGTRLRIARRALALSQLEFSSRAGISPTAMNNLEKGRSFPTMPVLVAICNVHGISADWICLGVMHGLRLQLADAIRALLADQSG